MDIHSLLDEAKTVMRRLRHPATTLTWGKEVEFFRTSTPPSGSYIYNLHRDYNIVWELDTPPVSFPPSDDEAFVLQVAEALAIRVGLRHSTFRKDGEDYTAGSHTHFRHSDYRTWALMFNWAVFLTPIMLPLLSLSSAVYEEWTIDGDLRYQSVYMPMFWRSRANYYAPPSRYIDPETIRNFEYNAYADRGFEPNSGNAWYYVELNKYRKDVTTAEIRLDEHHWLASLAFLDLLQALAKARKPPIASPQRLHYRLVTGYTIRFNEPLYLHLYKDDPDYRESDTLRDVIRKTWNIAEKYVVLDVTREIFEGYLLRDMHFRYSDAVALSAEYYPKTREVADYILHRRMATLNGSKVSRFY